MENVTFTFSYSENRGDRMFVKCFRSHQPCVLVFTAFTMPLLNRMGRIIFVWHEPKIDTKNIMKLTKYLYTLNVIGWCQNRAKLMGFIILFDTLSAQPLVLAHLPNIFV